MTPSVLSSLPADEAEVLHKEFARLQQGFDELEARLVVVEGRG